MLKALEIVAVLAAIVFAVALVGLIILYSSQPPNEPEQQQHSEKYEASQQKRELSKSFWQRTTEDPIAFFTLWLAIFTMILSAVAVIQIKFLVRAEGIATKTAQAAKDSATAASNSVMAFVDSERGRMFVSEIKLIKKDANDPQPTIDYSFVNGGRGTVIVLQVSIERELIGLEIPRDVTYDPTKSLSQKGIARGMVA
jgi:hypothetical protein